MKITNWMRILLVVLSFVMAFSLFSCSTEETPAATEGTTAGTQEDSTTKESADSTEATNATTEATAATETETSDTETETSGTASETETSETVAPGSDTETETSGTTTDTSETETSDTTETETDPVEPGCAHANKETTAAKAPTCTEDGNEAYSYCPDCQKYFDADGDEIEAPVVLPAGHSIEEVAAKEANCKKGGNEAYSICEACNTIWGADGTVLAEIPTTAIDPNNHLAYEEVAAVLPTTQEEGHEAYAKCRGCNKFWDAYGEEITEDQIVAIPVIVPTTNVYLGAAELATKVLNDKSTVTMSDDHSYVRFERTAKFEDGWFYLFETAEGTEPAVTGQYLIIKYRTDHATYAGFWADTRDNGITGGEDGTISMTADGEWHIIVMDLSKTNSKSVQANDNGEYAIQIARLDVLDQSADAGYVDVAYIAIADDVSKFAGIMQSEDEYLCAHVAPANPTYTNNDSDHSYACGICGTEIYEDHYIVGEVTWNAEEIAYTGTCPCGALVKSDMLHYSDPRVVNDNGVLASKEDGFVRYTATTAKNDDRYVLIYANGLAVTGRYMVIKYRAYDPGATEMTLRSYYAGSAMSTNSGAAGNGDSLSNGFGSFIADGEWHYQIIYIKDEWVNREQGHLALNADGTFTWKYLRIGFNTSVADGSAYLDIETLAFADRIEAVENYIFKDTPGNTEENPIYLYDTEASVKVAAGKTAYVSTRAGGMILTLNGNATVVHNGETYTAVDGVVTIPECVGNMWTPSMFAITNNGDADATFTLSFAYPEGHMENPAEIVNGDNTANIEAGSQGYFFEFIAPYDGTLTLTISSEAGWTYCVNNLTSYQYGDTRWFDDEEVINTVELTVKAGDQIQIMVNTYDPENMWEAPAGTVTVEAYFEAVAGSEGNPIVFTDVNNTITVPAGATVYYTGRFGGMVLTATGNVSIAHAGATYEAVDGVVVIPNCVQASFWDPCVFAFTNNTDADVEVAVAFTYPVGSMDNPAEAVEGDNTVNIEANSQGYFFTLTVPADGTLVVAIKSEGGWTYVISNMTTYQYGDSQWSDSDPVVNPARVAVKAGDVIQIMVNTYDPENMWAAPAGELTVNISYSDCDHLNKGELVPQKDKTCTEDGYEAYYVCEDCGKYIDANGVVITAPVVIPASHEKVDVEAKDPTCTAGGNNAYTYCSECDVLWNAEGAVIDAIPTLPANGHAKQDVAAQAAGITEKGWDAYKTCANCDQLFDAEGNEINAIPYIDALTDLEIYYDANTIKGLEFNKLTMVDITLMEDDGTYVRFARKGTKFSDGTLMLLSGNTKVTGQYVIFKYRTDHMTVGEFWNNTTMNGHSNGSSYYQHQYTTDGNWHIVVVDLADKTPSYIRANENGEYIIQWSRIDLLNSDAANGYFDLAWVAFCDNVADIAPMITEGEKAACGHYYVATADCKKACAVCGFVTDEVFHNMANGYTEEGNVRTYESGCKNCGEGYFSYTVTFGDVKPNTFYDASDIVGRVNSDKFGITGEVLSENGVGFVRITAADKSGEQYFHLVPAGSKVNSGRYAVIKYRTTVANQWQIYTGAKKADGGATSNAGSGSNFYTNSSYGNVLVANGEWQYMFIDLGALTNFKPNEDGTYTLTHFRIDIFDTGSGARYIDVAYIAFADDITELTAIGNNATCAHVADANGFGIYNDNDDSTVMAKLSATCMICNGIIVKDIDIASHPSSVTGATSIETGIPGGVRGKQTQSAADLGVTVGESFTVKLNLWTIFAGNADAGMFRILDAEGNVIVDWTDATETVQSKALGTMIDAQDIKQAAGLPNTTADNARRFVLAANLIPASGKTVTVEFAIVWTEAVEAGTNDTLIPIYTLTDLVVPEYVCPHTNCTEVAQKDATCTENGTEAYKICNGCYKMFNMNGEEITAPAVIPAAHKTTSVEAKAPTCTADGNDAYSICSVCNTIWNAEGAVIDAIPTITAPGHEKVAVDAKDATCTEDGYEAYTKCNNCDALWNAEGTETIDAVTVIPALNHEGTVETYEKKYATTKEKGNEKYSACTACGAMWDANGEVIYSVPEIAEVAPTTNVYLGYEELKNKMVNGTEGSLFGVEAAEDRSYVRFKRTGKSTDGSVMFLEGNTAETGKYLVFKYRTDNQKEVQVWANTTMNGHSNGASNFYYNTITDGNWHIAIIDLSAHLNSYVKADENGKYTIQWSRIDILDGEKTSGYFDIAYLAYTSDPADFASILQDGDKALCTHIIAENPVYANLVANHSTECAICGETMFFNHSINGAPTWNAETQLYSGNCICGQHIEQEYVYISEANTAGGAKSATIEQKDGFVRYTKNGSSDPYIHIYLNGSAVTGQFAVIKYRTNGPRYANSFVGSTAGQHSAASAGCDSNKSKSAALSFIADEEWHYVVLEASSTCFVANGDGTYSFRFLRLGLGSFTDGQYLDIDEIVFTDNFYAAEKYAFTRDTLPRYVGNLDKTNCSLNGEVLTDSIRGTFAPIVLNLDGKTVENPKTGLVLGGWLCTPGGVASYKYRVVSVNGEKIANPELIDWQVGANRGDIYANAGLSYGFSDGCAKGAGIGKVAIDLSAYADMKVSLEIVAITNYGKELVVAQLNDLTVGSLECQHTECTNVDAKAPTCTEDGYQAYKYCNACSKKFTMDGEAIAAPVVVPAAHTYVEHEKVDATCTATGMDAYKSCANCEVIFNMEGTVIDALPVIEMAEHNLEEVGAKAPTCTEAGYEAYEKCADCDAIYVNGEKAEAPTAVPAAHTYVTNEKVDATCIATGMDAYKSCANCSVIFNMDGEVIDALPVIEKAEHTLSAVDGKAPTCTEAGYEAYEKCDVCNKMFANGAEIEAPVVVPATNHAGTVTVYEKKYATTQAKGNEKYSACTKCGAMWNANGEVIYAIPEIDTVVPTTEKYWGAYELSQMTVYSTVSGNDKFTATMSDDCYYTRFERVGTGRDGAIYIADNKDSTEVTGQYLIYKYRTDHVTQIELFATTEGGTNGNAHIYPTHTADGQWHIAIYNLAESLAAYVKPEEDGSYVLTWARMDIFDAEASAGYFDIAWMVTCDNPADVAGIMQAGDKDLCTHIIATEPVYANLGANHSTQCAICGETMFFNHSMEGAVWNVENAIYSGKCICDAEMQDEAIYVAEPTTGALSCFKAEVNDGVVKYTKTKDGDTYIHIYTGGTVVTGKFAVIKYRTTVAGSSYSSSYVGSVKGDHATASAGCDGNSGLGKSATFVADGDWHYLIMEAKSTCFKPNEDGTYSYRFLRLSLSGFAVDQFIEIDEIAFVDNHYAAQLIANGGEAECAHYSTNSVWLAESQEYVTTCVGCGHEMYRGVCPHSTTSNYVWNPETKLYNATCAACADVLTKEMLYVTDSTKTADPATGAEPSGGFMEVVHTDGITKYTPVKSAGDPFFYPLRNNNSNVTGQYVVIKYRLVNNDTNMTVGAIFASTAAHGRATAAGNSGDNQNNCVGDKTLYADGQWHYMIITVSDRNQPFTPNAD